MWFLIGDDGDDTRRLLMYDKNGQVIWDGIGHYGKK